MCWIEFFCLFFFPARRIIGFPSSCWFHFSCLASRKMRDSISRKCTQPALLLLQCCCCVHYFVKTDGPVNISLPPNHLIVSGTIFRALLFLLYFGSTFLFCCSPLLVFMEELRRTIGDGKDPIRQWPLASVGGLILGLWIARARVALQYA